MENQTKLALGMILTLVAAISGTYYVADDDQAYHCEAKDMVMLCEKLSSGKGTRCYFEDTYKICKEGWVKLEVGQEVVLDVVVDEIIPKSSSGIKWSCSPESCVRIS